MHEITNALRLLCDMPGAGHFRPDLTSDPVKFWPVFSYFIVYDHVARPIGIARVLHGSRDIAAVLARTGNE
jgi:antitoxin ParD1/3/4/toxin ParE1/3/4